MSMMSLILIVAFGFVLVLWLAVGVRHLKLSKRGVFGSWEFVDEKIRKRHDIVPLLVEVVRGVAAADLVTRAAAVRGSARKIYFACPEKSEKEYDFSKVLQGLIEAGVNDSTVSKNILFLELKKEIEDLNKDIENRAKEYNEAVSGFNFSKQIFVLRPLAWLLRMKRAIIFEFEKSS